MKIFFAVLIAAAVIGGFIGGELSGTTFSLLGATVGGIGLAIVLLSLGAYFTAQEERKSKKLTPEMRGIFDRMLGVEERKTESKWAPRPFFENKSDDEFIQWFRNVSPWNKVDALIIQVLIDKFRGNPLFEVFVHTSQEQSLIKRYAEINQIARSDSGRFAVAPKIAMILSSAAEDNREKYARAISAKDQNAMKVSYSRAVDSVEVALVIEPNIALLYLQMATLKAMLGKNEEATQYCQAGLQVIEKQKKIPFHKSEISSVNQAHSENERIGAALHSVLEKLPVKQNVPAPAQQVKEASSTQSDSRMKIFISTMEALGSPVDPKNLQKIGEDSMSKHPDPYIAALEATTILVDMVVVNSNGERGLLAYLMQNNCKGVVSLFLQGKVEESVARKYFLHFNELPRRALGLRPEDTARLPTFEQTISMVKSDGARSPGPRGA